MTPLARRVMEKVREKEHGTYERWMQAIVDATLEDAAERIEPLWRIEDPYSAADAIRALKTPEKEPCE